jgi:hypothetical protein
MPSCITQQGRDPAITIAAILAGQFNHIRNQALFVFPVPWRMSLCGSMLFKSTTSPTFRNTQLVTHPINALPATCGAG